MNNKKKKVLTIDPEQIPEGSCIIKESLIDQNQKFSICKENGKIKIFPVFEIKNEKND